MWIHKGVKNGAFLLLSFKLRSETFSVGNNKLLFIVSRLEMKILSAKKLHFLCGFFFFFMIATQGRTIKRSSSLDVVTLRYCSISVMASPPSIFAFLSGFCTQKSNYGLLYNKVLICSYGEGQRASFVCSLHWSQRSMQCYALHFSTFTAMFFNNCQCQA